MKRKRKEVHVVGSLKQKISMFWSSIRMAISATYIYIYLFVAVLVLCTFVIGLFYMHTKTYSAELNQVYSTVQRDVKLANTRKDKEAILAFIKKNTQSDEVILIEKNIVTASTTGNIYLNDYINNTKRNVVTSLFPQLSAVSKGYVGISLNLTSNDKIIAYYPIMPLIYQYEQIFRLVIYALLVGLLVVIIVGVMRTRHLLKPIQSISDTTRMISAENLDLRIDATRLNSELKELAVTINQMMDRIQNSYQKQQIFVSDVSHELRTPIAVIAGYASMLKRWGAKDEEVLDESVDAIISESKNMTELIEKLLFLARHDKNTNVYHMQLVDFSQIVHEAAKETAMIDTTHELESAFEESLYIEGDEGSIKQLCRILIDNAIKYTPEGKKIKISIEQDKNDAVFMVEDHGVGISKEDMPKIFDRFYRTDKSRTKTNVKGYGLGLSIARIIVLDHFGKIIVQSKLGEGSRFIVRIPLKRKPKNKR